METTQQGGPLERRIKLAVPLAEIETEVNQRLQRLTRTVKLAGFRPGKVPLKIVQQQYGGQVRQEVLGDTVQKTFTAAVREQKLRIAGYPRIEPEEAQENAGELAFNAIFEVYPEFEVGDVSGIEIEKLTAPLDEAEIDRTIEILRKQRATYIGVERAAQIGDKLNIDFVGTLDGVAFPGGSAQGTTLTLGEGAMLKDFESQLEGMKPNENKEFELTFPADYQAKELAGKTVKFAIKLNQVEAPQLPPVDADFARSLGVADGDLAKLRAEIRDNLKREVAKRVMAHLKEQVMQALYERTRIDLPKALIDEEVMRLAERAKENLAGQGMDTAKLALPPAMFEEQAKKRVALGLILSQLVKQQKLEVKPEQVKQRLEEFAAGYDDPQQVINWYRSDRSRMAEVESLVLEDNVVSWVLERAKVTDKPVEFEAMMKDK